MLVKIHRNILKALNSVIHYKYFLVLYIVFASLCWQHWELYGIFSFCQRRLFFFGFFLWETWRSRFMSELIRL
jgi:hypothetical protein